MNNEHMKRCSTSGIANKNTTDIISNPLDFKKFKNLTVSSVGEVKQPKHTLAGLTQQPRYSHLPIQ